jgi:hypothetical protein
MRDRLGPGASKLFHDVGHRVAVPDHEDVAGSGIHGLDESRRIGGIVDDRDDPRRRCERSRRFLGAAKLADVDDTGPVALVEALREQLRLRGACRRQTGIGAAFRFKMSHHKHLARNRA